MLTTGSPGCQIRYPYCYILGILIIVWSTSTFIAGMFLWTYRPKFVQRLKFTYSTSNCLVTNFSFTNCFVTSVLSNFLSVLLTSPGPDYNYTYVIRTRFVWSRLAPNEAVPEKQINKAVDGTTQNSKKKQIHWTQQTVNNLIFIKNI